MQQTFVASVRRFNRTVTQRAGALNDAFLSRKRPLGQARVLWEIGEAGPGGCEVRALRSDLDLDSGYLSRLLRALESDGLVEVVTDESSDGRVRFARLTATGMAEHKYLNQASDELAAEILAPLNEKQRERLVTAMADVERLLTASQVEIAVTDPRLPVARHCLTTYFEELATRFDSGYDPALGISASDPELTMPAGLLLVATLHGAPVGCGALKFGPDATAHIKRMWVDRSARGLGLGRRLLAELETQAASHGVSVLRLDTNRVLTEAIAMYRAAGYREVDRFNEETYANHWFEKVL
ncbi:bifunctional helix-turn-helix transcriptional regulator/GNAT family N-acetyltransferase [Actinospica sp.]|jgi:DNA-binding MarR family transcriptional regulator/GNAT superfamily N-acetyltransferase|uniref:bifunctional helix-turn-helix transcriptional regulator/GNAT family N-acetyltransferase n=1 Tax=Actinospica sp. TaxID=1872142 RepID=UPI002B5D6894|nr:bifunctional helix-turn-helix transcriptional regulator/GNAT family N-acetyltransferase [Actinospica sp.]HWG23844.1 bifunctional helix-turn-helix transcriptional regulator/GNAT family N-acetyltransferase [Actinospica sp.]